MLHWAVIDSAQARRPADQMSVPLLARVEGEMRGATLAQGLNLKERTP
jgi:hypothetical protein